MIDGQGPFSSLLFLRQRCPTDRSYCLLVDSLLQLDPFKRNIFDCEGSNNHKQNVKLGIRQVEIRTIFIINVKS